MDRLFYIGDEVLMCIGAFLLGTLHGRRNKPTFRNHAIAWAAFVYGIILAIFGPEAHGLTPPAPLPAYLPGDDVVIVRRETCDGCETLTGKHATVTDIAWNKYTRKVSYDVNLQGWGDFERHTENVVTRRQWEVMREDWMRWNWYPS